MPEKSAPNKSQSAIKRVRQTKKRTLRNKSTKNTIKTLFKKIETETANKSTDEAKATLKTASSLIDKAAQKGILHKKTAARRVSRLTKFVNSQVPSEAT